ncbi:hypothetical protein GCM10010121_086610 [Streptomyces brasiliensis]|uniref:Uncharacterized protein n=1 Tax=Streptomyces brasiliensis TaxID=1954 RepID=A0A917UJR3_9ACTN|nr:hypothetical protein GCM10010121_086610 [Streptomyces brasiliensis]
MVIVLRTAPQLSVCWTSVRLFRTVPIGVISKLGMARGYPRCTHACIKAIGTAVNQVLTCQRAQFGSVASAWVLLDETAGQSSQ